LQETLSAIVAVPGQGLTLADVLNMYARATPKAIPNFRNLTKELLDMKTQLEVGADIPQRWKPIYFWLTNRVNRGKFTEEETAEIIWVTNELELSTTGLVRFSIDTSLQLCSADVVILGSSKVLWLPQQHLPA
jgi:hypothetical protein